MRCLIIVAILTVAAATRAQSVSPPGMTESSMWPAPRPSADEKSPAVAYLLSAAGTATPVLIMYVAARESAAAEDVGPLVGGAFLSGLSIIFLPSAGHWYAGSYGTWAMGARAVGAGVATVALLSGISCGCPGHDQEAVFFGGVALAMGGAIYEVATAGGAVDTWNREHAANVSPTIVRTGDGYGLGLVGSF
jgi:hypothetical protein